MGGVVHLLDSKEFNRLKIGIGVGSSKIPKNIKLIDYVLGGFAECEVQSIKNYKENIFDLVSLFLVDDIEIINRKYS